MMALLPIPATAQQAAPTPSKIAVVEQGLTSAVVLAGAPAPHRTIETEMRRLNVPGSASPSCMAAPLNGPRGTGSREQVAQP